MIISQVVRTEQQSKPSINIHHFTFHQDETYLYQSKEDMVKKFSEEGNISLNEKFKLMQEARRSIPIGASLLTIKEKYSSTLRIPINDKIEVSQVRIQIDKIGIPDKINSHKQASKLLYSYFLQSYLNKSKLENKVVKLEEQIMREKVAAKGWKVQVKKLEVDLVAQRSKEGDKKATKMLMDEKDK